MIRVYLLLLLTTFCGLSGCIVEVSQPVGTKVDRKTLKSYEGTWLVKGDNDAVMLRLNKNGVLQSASIAWQGDEQKFKLEEYTLDLRKVGNHVYAFSKEDGALTFLKWVQTDTDTIQLLMPASDKFRDAVKAGLFEADSVENKNEKSDIRVVSDEKLEKFLAAEDIGSYLIKDVQITLERMKSAPAK